jgi:hypothetical protein
VDRRPAKAESERVTETEAALLVGLAEVELVDPVVAVVLDLVDEDVELFLVAEGVVVADELLVLAEVVELVVVSAFGLPPAFVMYDSTLPAPLAGVLTPSTIPFLHWSSTDEKK